MEWDRLNIDKPIEHRIIKTETAEERDDLIDFAKTVSDGEISRPGLDPEAYRGLQPPVPFNKFLSQRALRAMTEAAGTPEHPFAEKARTYLHQLNVAHEALAA